MWTYWCIFPSSLGKLAFLALLERGKKNPLERLSENVLHQVWLNWILQDELPQEFIPITLPRGFSPAAATLVTCNKVGFDLSGSLWEDVFSASRRQINAAGNGSGGFLCFGHSDNSFLQSLGNFSSSRIPSRPREPPSYSGVRCWCRNSAFPSSGLH